MPERPIDLYLRAQRVTDRALARLLLAAAEDAEKRVLARAGDRISDVVTRAQMNLVSAELRQQAELLWPDIDNEIKQGIFSAAEAAADAENQLTRVLYEAGGLPAPEMAAAVRQQARQGAENLFSRKVAGRDLSQRVYRTSVGAQGMIQRRLNLALAQGANWRRIAADVKDLINPRTPGGVSYAAKRLARTELNNAFHETQMRSARMNPFVTAMKWHLSSSHPEADICDTYAHDDHEGKGEGVFSKQNVPSKPHPQDLCYLAPVVVDDDEFVKQFKAGKYDDYLDDIIEDMPIPPAARLMAESTDELANFVLQKREEGWSWARIANEANARGLSPTTSPGAMRAVARKHGISNTGPIKKGTQKVKPPEPPVNLRPPTTAAKPTGYQIGDVVEVRTLSGTTERIQLTRVPSKLLNSTYSEFYGVRVNAYGKAFGRPVSRILDPAKAKKLDIKVTPPTTRTAARQAAARRTSGVADREVSKYFRQFDGWDEAHVAKMQRKYKELADEYLHDKPNKPRDLPMVRGQFNKAELKAHDSAFGLYGGSAGSTIRMQGAKYFSKGRQLDDYIRSQRRQVKSRFKAERAEVDHDIYTFVHEFGHHIESVITGNGAYANKLDGVFNKFFNYMENRASADLIPQSYETLSASLRASTGYDLYGARFNAVIERFKPEITMGLSKYATENWMEFMAECFAEYKLNPNPRPIARMFGEFIDEVLHL